MATKKTKKGGRTMYLIDEIRKFETEGLALEDLVTLSAVGRVIQEEFKTLNVEQPEWLDAKMREIRKEISLSQADRLQKMLREKKSRLEALLPAEEKRQALKDEIAKLEEQLKGQ